ncbi:Conserved_hypothetical protein [Hexamita inflata]|uniref:Uncharacterized protein n=1 Tax=Hexamita inflata TaxID=28002 RepID=A0ABP1GGR2_9EUKA
METIKDFKNDYEQLCANLQLREIENSSLKEHLTLALHTIEQLKNERAEDMKLIAQLSKTFISNKRGNKYLQNSLFILFLVVICSMAGIMIVYK